MKLTYGSAAALLLTMLPVTAAAAQERPGDERAFSAPSPAADPFAAADALDEKALGKIAGREDTALLVARATQQNTVANNSVTGNSVTGNVQIDGNAFQNLQGLAVISANSGNNVAINSAMNVTINMAPR